MFTSIDSIKAANARSSAPHWFSPISMRFFGTRVSSTIFGGRFFITSEFTGFDRTERAFTVRRANDDGTIETVGEIAQHATRSKAITAARQAARDSQNVEA